MVSRVAYEDFPRQLGTPYARSNRVAVKFAHDCWPLAALLLPYAQSLLLAHPSSSSEPPAVTLCLRRCARKPELGCDQTSSLQ